jgi:hypothetical protein
LWNVLITKFGVSTIQVNYERNITSKVVYKDFRCNEDMATETYSNSILNAFNKCNLATYNTTVIVINKSITLSVQSLSLDNLRMTLKYIVAIIEVSNH